MVREKKTIVIEAQRIFRRNKHGMDLVALEMIRSLQKIDDYNNYIIAVGPGEDRCLKSTSNFKIVELGSSNYLIWEQFLLPRLVRQVRADLLHCTSNTAPIYCATPFVLTLHDIIFMEKAMGSNKSLYQNLGRIYRRFIVPRVLEKARKVITVSHFEENNILRYYPQLKDKILAVYNGVSPDFRPIERFTVPRLESVEKGCYWFFLGNTDPKKNIENTLKAYAYYLRHSQQRRKLLLADLKADRLDELLLGLKLEDIRAQIVVEEYITHHVLAEVYTKAFGFLYPSLRESFGLPLLEAMACGTPVVAANSSAIPEVAGDSVVYVDPASPQSIARGMLCLEADAQLYKNKITQGLARSSIFSWAKTAEHTWAVYNDILNQTHGN